MEVHYMSTVNALTSFEEIPVKRTQLRQQQSAWLRRAIGRTVLVVDAANDSLDEKCVLDKRSFEELLLRMESLVESLEIMTDNRDFVKQILDAAPTLEEDLRRGKLHSLDEAFEDD
jgi:hypothetical protein